MKPNLPYDENGFGMGNAAQCNEPDVRHDRRVAASRDQHQRTPAEQELYDSTLQLDRENMRLRRVCNLISKAMLKHTLDETGNVRGGVPQRTLDFLLDAARFLDIQAARDYDGPSLPKWMGE